MDRVRKQEASISTQSRISIVSLARLDVYWSGTEYRIKSMSQLVSWSMDLLVKVLESNNMMGSRIDTVAEANRYLDERGLHQPSLKDRNFQKLGTAIRFESLRDEGVDPEGHVPGQYNILHNKRSVAPFSGSASGGEGSDMIQEAVKIYEKKEMEEKEEARVKYEKEMEEGREGQRNFVPGESSNKNKCVRLTEELVEGLDKIQPTADESPGEFRLRKKTEEELVDKEREIAERDKEMLALQNRPMSEILAEGGNS